MGHQGRDYTEVNELGGLEGEDYFLDGIDWKNLAKKFIKALPSVIAALSPLLGE